MLYLGDTTEKTMLSVFSAAFGSIFLLVLIVKTLAYQRTINSIYSIDLIPITGGTKKHFAGGIVTILYVVSLTIMISGVVVSYFTFHYFDIGQIYVL